MRRPSSIVRRGETENISIMRCEIANVVKKTGDNPWRSRPRRTARAFGFPVRCDTSTVILAAIGTPRPTPSDEVRIANALGAGFVVRTDLRKTLSCVAVAKKRIHTGR